MSEPFLDISRKTILRFRETGTGYAADLAFRGSTAVAHGDCLCCVGVLEGNRSPTWSREAYDHVRKVRDGLEATKEIAVGALAFFVTDRFSARDGRLEMRRRVQVTEGSSDAIGFSSAVEWQIRGANYDGDWFVPGTWYRQNAHVPPWAIASIPNRQRRLDILFREDRLPLPLVHYFDTSVGIGLTLAHIDADPRTTIEDDSERALIDRRLNFGSFGIRGKRGDTLAFEFPGSEGEVLYPPMWTIDRGNQQSDSPVNPFANKEREARSSGWIYRMHPATTGFEHTYTLSLWPERADEYADATTASWRTVWDLYSKRVNRKPLREIEAKSIQLLSKLTLRDNRSCGVPTWIDCFTGEPGKLQNDFSIGFVGRNLEVAYTLIEYGRRKRNEEVRSKGRCIVEFWVGEAGLGLCHTEYDYLNAQWSDHRGDDGTPFTYLRDQSEAHRAVLMCLLTERRAGVEHAEWFEWIRSYAQWLLSNSNDAGSYARAYDFSGRPLPSSDSGSIHAAAFLCDFYALTGTKDYLELAVKIAEYVWETHHARGDYYGATLDNPDCTDKEASAIAVDAYLRLFETTGEQRWLAAADSAARVCETWIIGWEIPMPESTTSERFYHPRATTVGLQLITTGFSAVDMYLSRQVGDFRRLSKYTGDRHYRHLARILLHNTKGMIQLDTELGYRYPGMQIEHWSIGRGRGFGLNSGWLPWVSSGHVIGYWGRNAQLSLGLQPGGNPTRR